MNTSRIERSPRAAQRLNIVDDASRECLAIEVDHGLSGLRVIRVLDHLALSRPLPRRIVVDNGPEFASTALDVWAYRRGVELQCTICKQCRYREGGPPGGPAYRHACRYGVSVPESPGAIAGTPGSLLYYEESSNTAAMIVC